MHLPPGMPPGRFVDLPGRGRAWVYDTGASGSAGDEPAVVLVHGWKSTSAQNWRRCVPALAGRYRVVAMDLRGHGRGIRSRVPFRLEDCADDLAALVGEMDLGPCTVVGYSMGGAVAQLTWRRHPEMVHRLVLCATAARFITTRVLDGSLGTAVKGASMALAVLPDSVRRQAMALVTRNWVSDGAIAPWAAEEWRLHDPAMLVQAGLALSRFDSTAWLGEIDVATAVVVTGRDTTVPTRLQTFLAQSIPGAEAITVEGDHRACVDQSESFVPALLSACETVPSGGTGARQRPL